MNATVKAGDLAKELGRVLRVIERKGTLPALQYVLAEGEGNGIKLTGTDLDVVLRGNCEAAGLATGKLLLPAQQLHDVMRTFAADAAVELKLGKDGAVKVSSGAYKGKLRSLDASEFPEMPEPPKDGLIARVASESLLSLVQRTQYALGSSDGPQGVAISCGRMLVSGKAKTMQMTACDGFRLSQSTTACAPGDGDAQVEIPGKAMRELRGFLDEDAEVEVRVTDDHIFFTAGNRQLITRRIDGKYPPVDRIIPKGYPITFTIGRVGLAEALRRVALVDTSEARSVKGALGENGQLTLAAIGEMTGEAAENVPTDYKGDASTFKCQQRFLTDFLDNVPCDQVEVKLKGGDNNLAAVVLTAIGPDAFAVVMTMK
jgi:DNA polymerase-3 subunit beta